MSEETEEEPQKEPVESEGKEEGLLSSSQRFYGRKRQAAVVVVCLVIIMSWLSVIDRKAENYVNDATVQALATYGTLRLANAGISVAKTAELGFVEPGAALDPLDTLIEEGSNVVRFAIGSLITQKLMLEIVSASFFKITLTLAGLILIGSLYFQGGRYATPFLKVFSLAALARFVFVLVVFLNALADQAFLDQKTEATRQNLEKKAGEISRATKGPENELSAKENKKLEERIEKLSRDREKLLSTIEEARTGVKKAKSELEQSEAELAALEEELGMMEQYFPEDSDHKALVEKVEKNRSTYEQKIEELDGLSTELDALDQTMADLRARLSGEDQSYWGAAMKKMESVKSITGVSALQSKAEAMIDWILRLMALFVLKTVIIPIIFLVLLLKGFRYIWGIDARTFASQQWNSAKEELQRGA